ncbi:hypothetical protein [Sporichthya sp.]|uniref:hypothetical protein n=1 Tax=Sporichthya sp. TaxID=65475 RepID=UPI0017E78C7B|nr:hypothetical protein [Sporichthya sp.]MBA3742505.1 hypothetical protein [Sporichthya sp.]
MAIRQRRIWSAQERVRALPGFAGLEHRWCDIWGSEDLDRRLADLGGTVSTQHWPGAEPLVEALRAAAAQVPAGTGFALLSDEPEALWVEASLSDLLQATATVLGVLQQGIVILSEDERMLLLEVTRDPEGRVSHQIALRGEWPAGALRG